MAAKKSRSGAQWGDADYEQRGYARLSLRLPGEVRALLDELAAEDGTNVTALITRLAEEERARRGRKRT